MRKYFICLVLAFAVAGFTACQESVLNVDIENGSVVNTTISAQALSATENTKADISELVYYLEVYSDGVLYEDLGSSSTGDFPANLITGLDYTFVAWADYGKGFYDAAGTVGEANLTAVNVNLDAYVINDEYRDAFAGAYDVEKFDGTAISFILTRPLSRINVATTDITELVVGSSLPTEVQLSYTTEIYTSYNVLTGEVNAESQLFETTTAALVDESGNISYDYLFAPSEGGVVDFTATFLKDGVELTSYSFASIAYKQNFQTNISGSLLGDVLAEYEMTTVAELQAGNYPTSDYWLITDETIPNEAFFVWGDTPIDVGDRKISIYCPNATSIGDYAFADWSNLTIIDLPEATLVGEYAFLDCSSLTAIELPEATSIEYKAFGYCTSLTAIELPKATTIRLYAFWFCTGLKTMTIATESQVTSWGTSVLSGVTTTNIDLTIGSLNSGVDVENKTWNDYTFKSITVI